jgi:hypothetical protein
MKGNLIKRQSISINDTTTNDLINDGQRIALESHNLIEQIIEIAKENKRLLTIKGGAELMQHLDEVIYETDLWQTNIIETVSTSKNVYYCVKNLHSTFLELKVGCFHLEKL